MSVSPILGSINTYSPTTLEHTEHSTPVTPNPETHHGESETDSITTHKGLSADELTSIQEEQTLSFKQMLYGMLNTQAGHSINASGATNLKLNTDLFSKLNINSTDSETAAKAISKDGEWGVDAVASRIMDMAVSLSGGDTSKIALLRHSVEKGFEAAGVQWGSAMPSITQETHDEINKQFDYWEKNGSLDGYGKTKEEE